MIKINSTNIVGPELGISLSIQDKKIFVWLFRCGHMILNEPPYLKAWEGCQCKKKTC